MGWFPFGLIAEGSSCTRFLFYFTCHKAILMAMLFIIMHLACEFNLFMLHSFVSTNQRFISKKMIFPKIRYHIQSHSVLCQKYRYHVNSTSVSLLLLSRFIQQFSVMSFINVCKQIMLEFSLKFQLTEMMFWNCLSSKTFQCSAVI